MAREIPGRRDRLLMGRALRLKQEREAAEVARQAAALKEQAERERAYRRRRIVSYIVAAKDCLHEGHDTLAAAHLGTAKELLEAEIASCAA